MNNVKDQIRAYILENFLMGLNEGVLTDDASFLNIGIIDSTGVIELVTYIEEQYGFKVDDSEMTPENLDSLSAIEVYVGRKTMRRSNAAGL